MTIAVVALHAVASGSQGAEQSASSDSTLPDQLYNVPPNIPDIADEPLHEPVAVAYQDYVRAGLFDEALVPIVVGAETGRVRSVRDAGERGHVVPSPNGTMLALANFGGIDFAPSELVVLDVVRSRTNRYELPDEGFGTGVSDVVWTPDGTEVMLTAEVTREVTRGENDGSSTARLVPGSLDLQTGRWEEHDDWTHAVSPDGRRVVGVDYSADYVVEEPDAEPVSLSIGETHDATLPHRVGMAFSPDGGRIAALASGPDESGAAYGFSVETYDANTGERVERVALGDYLYARLLGWSERGVVVQTTSETGVGWAASVSRVVSRPHRRCSRSRPTPTRAKSPFRPPC